LSFYICLKLSCDNRFQLAFTACICVFKEITQVWVNQGNYFENVNACNKRTLKTTVATQLNPSLSLYHLSCLVSVVRFDLVSNISKENCQIWLIKTAKDLSVKCQSTTYLVWISSTFYEQLLHVHIPKVKRYWWLNSILLCSRDLRAQKSKMLYHF